jgi:N-acetylmuramoyl-L-alanine amidase
MTQWLGDWFADADPADAFDAGDFLVRSRSTVERYLTDMADVLRAAGLTVTEQDGWRTRARGSGGYDAPHPSCIMWHHAASSPGATAEAIANYASYGSPDAPVCNLVLGRDGAVIVCAAGATNTNGKGGPVTLSHGVIALDQMNTAAISIEAVNSGVGEPWPVEQIDAYFAINNALAAAYGLDPADLCTHAGWCEPSCPGRKIDPATASAVQGPWQPASINLNGTWSQDDVRAEARARAAITVEDDDMQAATLWRPQGYLNVFLIGAGSTVTVSPAVLDSLQARGVPLVVEAHAEMLEVCLYQTGLTMSDLTPGGG